MTTKTIQILLFLVLSNSVFAQFNVGGIVFDKDREELYNANITIAFGDSVKEANTDFDGAFRFKNVQSEHIHLSIRENGYYDYDTIIQLTSDKINLKFNLILDSTSYIQTEILLQAINKEKAVNDIKIGMIKIFLPGGIVASSELPGDEAFEKKYGVWFMSLGCIRSSGDNYTDYNEQVFKYLDKKFGKEWKNEIRKDAIGFKGYVK